MLASTSFNVLFPNNGFLFSSSSALSFFAFKLDINSSNFLSLSLCVFPTVILSLLYVPISPAVVFINGFFSNSFILSSITFFVDSTISSSLNFFLALIISNCSFKSTYSKYLELSSILSLISLASPLVFSTERYCTERLELYCLFSNLFTSVFNWSTLTASVPLYPGATLTILRSNPFAPTEITPVFPLDGIDVAPSGTQPGFKRSLCK